MNDSSRRRARDSASEAARFLRFSSRYHDDIAAGRKRATTRFQDPVRLGPTIFVFEDEDEASRRLLGHIDSVESHRFDASATTSRGSRTARLPTSSVMPYEGTTPG